MATRRIQRTGMKQIYNAECEGTHWLTGGIIVIIGKHIPRGGQLSLVVISQEIVMSLRK